MREKPSSCGEEWEAAPPEELGFDPERLEQARKRLNEQVGAQGRYRVVIVRGGRIAAEWNRGIDASQQRSIASTNKSLISCLLGIAIEEGMLPSANARDSRSWIWGQHASRIG